MTLQEIEDAIQFRIEKETDKPYDVLVATIGIHGSIRIPALRQHDGEVERAKEHLRQMLLSRLYDNRRKEMAELGLSLLRNERNLSPEGYETINRMIGMANWTPPEL